jgi:putative nucleotidyltransferase with HDIG domain
MEAVIAPEDLSVTSQELTRLELDRALALVPAVYDYDPNVLKATLARVHEYFSKSHAIWSGPGPAAETTKNLGLAFQNAFGHPASRSLLTALTTTRFGESLESHLSGLLERILREGVLSTVEVLEFSPSPSRIVLRNIVDNSEFNLAIPPQSASPIQARTRIHEEIMRWAVLPRGVRGEFAALAENLITVNGFYNPRETAERRRAAEQGVQPIQIFIAARTVLLHAGETVTPDKTGVLNALRALENMHRQPRYLLGLYFSSLLFAFFIWRYLLQRPSRELAPDKQFLVIMVSFVVLLALIKIMLFSFEVLHESISSLPFSDPLSSKLAIPFAAAALLITLLLGADTGMVCAIVFALCVGYMGRSTVLSIYALFSGLAAIYAVRQYRDRGAVIRASLIVGFSNFIIAFGLRLMTGRHLDWRILLFDFGNSLLGGIFVAGCVSLFLPLFETAFDVCTDVRLLELSNLNLPILRRLAAEAPGTYHHSILVGVMAEAGAEAIGANPLLARVACLYHDIGKIVKSSYYIENSMEAEQRHDQMPPKMSSSVIIDHVKEGLELARKIRLPRRVAEIIPQHHGTSLVTYFYHKAINDPDADEMGISEDQFRYPGPRPRSREAALVMLADSIEAASRTVDHQNPKKFQNVVDRIVTRFLDDHQLDECQLTLNDILLAKQAFARALAGIYHQRIAYPGRG